MNMYFFRSWVRYMKEKIELVLLIILLVVLILFARKYVGDKSESIVNTKNVANATSMEQVANIENAVDVVDTTGNQKIEGNDTNNSILELTDDSFDEVVQNTDKKILVDFYADWCQPCKMLEPIVEEVSKENQDVLFVRVNVDENRELSNKYAIRALPTLVVIKNGEEINRVVGLVEKAEVERLLSSN